MPVLSGVEGTRRLARHGMSSLMRKLSILALLAVIDLAACSPRDFLTRRLAADLISTSATFKSPQRFVLQTGTISNQDYSKPEYGILQHHGWITANNAPCPSGLAPPPCWDVLLTPSGVETVRALIPQEEASKPSIAIPVARRQLLNVTGIAKDENSADVEFTWKWIPVNEIGAALYPGDVRSESTVGFRNYDDGWRVVEKPSHSGQAIDDALKNAEPVP
jgi:hypothetical protein